MSFHSPMPRRTRLRIKIQNSARYQALRKLIVRDATDRAVDIIKAAVDMSDATPQATVSNLGGFSTVAGDALSDAIRDPRHEDAEHYTAHKQNSADVLKSERRRLVSELRSRIQSEIVRWNRNR